MTTPPTLAAFVAWLEAAPPGTTIDAAHVLERLRACVVTAPAAPVLTSEPAPLTWRERLWTVPAETRLGVHEVAEALDRPKSWVYRHCSERTGLALLPHRNLDSALAFVAGELRTWVAEHEDVIVRAPRPTRLAALLQRSA